MERAAVALALLLLLAGCGGDEPAAEATVAVVPTRAAAEPTAPVPTEPPAPTEPAPTVVATAAVATDAPTPTPEADDTSGGVATACGHEFFPVVEGQVRRYRNDVPVFGPSEFTQTISDVTGSSATITTQTDEEAAVVFNLECREDGLWSPELLQITNMEGLTMEYVESSGVSIPTADHFRVGETWATHFVANGTMPGEAGGTTMVQTVDLAHEVVAIEPISVPAGDYPEAVRVETTGTLSIAMTVAGEAQPPSELPMAYTTWYVAGVGMVRQEIGGLLGIGGAPIISQLIGVE